VPLLTEILGALAAGALVVVIASQLGAELRRAFGAVALVVVAVAVVLAAPKLREDINSLRTQHDQYAPLSSAEAQVQGGVAQGVNTDFLTWAREHMEEGETFHLEIGNVPGEELFEGSGVNQAATFAWASYQLAPYVSVEQSSSLHDLEAGEGRNADWLVFYEMSPKEYEGKLGEVLTYAPKFAIARTADAG
jgi:hypothetical protein